MSKLVIPDGELCNKRWGNYRIQERKKESELRCCYMLWLCIVSKVCFHREDGLNRTSIPHGSDGNLQFLHHKFDLFCLKGQVRQQFY